MSTDDSIQPFPPVDGITPEEFELLVKGWFEAQATSLESFEARHKAKVSGMDGDFEIDVSVRFTMFGGARFHVLAECKRHCHPIKRDVVQILSDRLRSTGAQKGFVFATAGFQSGAIDYAAMHGIALVQVASGHTFYIQATWGPPPTLPPGIPKYVGWHLQRNADGNFDLGPISANRPEHLSKLLTGTE